MIDSLDDLIYSEILFGNQRIKDLSHEEYETVLKEIIALAVMGHSLKKIKDYIKTTDVLASVEDTTITMIQQQANLILGDEVKEPKEVNIDEVLFAGLTLKELVKYKKIGVKNDFIMFASDVVERVKNKNTIRGLVNKKVKKFKKSVDTLVRTHTKQAREYHHAKVELIYKNDIIGWVSIAVLDNRTSSTCLGYHDNFYNIVDYPSRLDVPNPPPRHPNCRSIIAPVWSNTDKGDYTIQSADDFLRQNPNLAREILGKKKSAIYLTGKNPIKRFIDITGNRYFTNEQIIKKLKIKSKKRLRKIKEVSQ